jgi:hypothetical protein
VPEFVAVAVLLEVGEAVLLKVGVNDADCVNVGLLVHVRVVVGVNVGVERPGSFPELSVLIR